MATMGFVREGSTLMTRFIHFLSPLPPCPPAPFSRGKKKRTEQGVVERTLRKRRCWVVRKVGLQANDRLVPSKQEEVSLPRLLLARASSLGLSLQFCSPWHSFPVESRSGPPSPHVALKQASLFPSWELTFTERVEAPKGPSTKKMSLL